MLSRHYTGEVGHALSRSEKGAPIATHIDALQLANIARRAARAAATAVRASSAPGNYTGTLNAGGDRVLAVDVAADEAAGESIGQSMEALHQPYSIFSEESGLVDRGASHPLFVVDPLDGSAQARRRHPDCAVSIAVAIGPTFADLVAGVVQPIVGGEPYLAVHGRGARLGGHPLPLTPVPDGAARSVLLEGYHATMTAELAARFAAHDPDCQLHASGSIALQLSLLAAGCYDGLVAGRAGACSYDVAAAWLIAREAGIAYADLSGLDTLHAPLTDPSVHHHAAGARTQAMLEMVLAVARRSTLK